MLDGPSSTLVRRMFYATGSTHLAPTTGVTTDINNYYRQQRHTHHLPKPDERDVLRRVNYLHRTRVHGNVVRAAHLMGDLLKSRMTDADYRKGLEALKHSKRDCNQIAHSDGPTPHRHGFNRYTILPNEPAPLRHAKDYLAWHDLGTAINLFEGNFYPDEVTSYPARDAPTTRR